MSKKLVISKLWLYRYRFIIGFIFLGLIYVVLLFLLPFLAPNGLSEAEMASAATSYDTNFSSILAGQVADLPYHSLQKISIRLLGLSIFSVKLPSIIIGVFLGFFLILLLNRWFKSNVALIASILTVLSSCFLFLAGSGTPLIMLVFYPTVLLWLGSKIQGNKKVRFHYIFFLLFTMLASLTTPYMVYINIIIGLITLSNPHLRFTLKRLSISTLVFSIIISILGIGVFVAALLLSPNLAQQLLFGESLSLSQFGNNIIAAFIPFFSWSGAVESTFLAPFIGLASVALALIGLFSTTKGFFASRNSIASCFIIITILLSGLDPSNAVLIILPAAILVAHGIRYLLAKWYDLFPDNPYARIAALFPIGIFLGIIIISDISHFIFGYRYTPAVADHFNNDTTLINQNLEPGTTIYALNYSDETYAFYEIYEKQDMYNVENILPESLNSKSQTFAVIGTPSEDDRAILGDAAIDRIITSPKSDNSARIYIYSINNTESE